MILGTQSAFRRLTEVEFPGHEHFVVMTKADWQRIHRYINRDGLPPELNGVKIVNLEIS